MGLMDGIKNFLSSEEEEFEMDEDELRGMTNYEQGDGKFKADKLNFNMMLFEPRAVDDREEIGKHLKMRRACVINLHRLAPEAAQRTIDFLCGILYAIDGKAQKVGTGIILCTPPNVTVGGAIDMEETTSEE